MVLKSLLLHSSLKKKKNNFCIFNADDSQSTSPEEGASSSGTGASPRINRFLAREPPDGCEKVIFIFLIKNFVSKQF